MSLIRNFIWVGMAIICYWCLPAFAGTSVTSAQLYQKALTSDLNFSYTGKQFITTYHDDGRSTSYMTMVAHRAPDDFKIVYLAPARDSGRTIIEDAGQQWTLMPRDHSLLHSKQHLQLSRKQLAAKFSLLSQNYRLSISPNVTTIAQRKVFALQVSPRTLPGSSCKLWIDPDTGLILRKEQYHSDGQLASVMYYSELSISKAVDINDFSIDNLTKGHPKIVEVGEPDEMKLDRGTVDALFSRNAVVPESIGGFKLQSLMLMRGTKRPTLHLRYSDGLTSLSLFEDVRSPKSISMVPHSRPVLLRQGCVARALQQYTYNLLNWDSRQFNFTLVGDVRLMTLIQFAKARHVFD